MGVIAPQDQERIGQAVADRVFQTVQLAAEKAAAHEQEPQAYPIPRDSDSLEQICLSMLRTAQPEVKQRAVTQLTTSLRVDKTTRISKLGKLAEVDLKSVLSISEQVRALPLPDFKLANQQQQASPPPIDLDGDVDKIVLKSLSSGNVVEALQLRVTKVHCIDETNPEPFGSDEMRLSGVGTNPDGYTFQLPKLNLGDHFDDGDWSKFPPQTVATFNLNVGKGFPKGCIATLVLAEADGGGLSSFVAEKLLPKVQAEVTAQLKAAAAKAAQALEAWIGMPAVLTTAVLSYAIDLVVGKLFDWLKGLFNDDLFKPFPLSFEVPSAVAEINAPASIIWTGHGGKYQVFFEWFKPRGQHRFNAIWTPSEQGQFLAWGKTIDQINTDYGNMWKHNFRLIDLQAYVVNGQVLYNGVWNPANHGQSVVWDWALKDFGTHYGKMWNDNFRLICQQAFVVNGQVLYNGVWNPANHSQFVSWGKSGETINKQYGEMWNQKMRLVDLQAYVVNNQVFYDGIWNPGEYGQFVVWSDDLSVFKTRYNDMLKQNFHLHCQQAFIINGQVRYLGVWNATNEKRIATWDQSIDVLGKVYGEQWNKKFRLLDMDIF